MKPDKQFKKEFKQIAAKDYQHHYPVKVLEKLGFRRGTCTKCHTNFWSKDHKRTHCGDASCEGGYSFIGNTPVKKPLGYIEVWQRFKHFFEKRHYLAVPRKDVVARWRDDAYWVAASVYGFQPYVVRGEIEPPSNAVIIPQLSLRFNDIDNVGITGSHYVCFDMLGQLHFEKKEDYDIQKYFQEYFDWITTEEGMGVPPEELVLHEDAWAGGGSFGPCMEFFSRGLEIGNQVYMQYQQTETEKGYEELNIKVLDMGQGHERVPWFTSGKSTSYETTFPTVVDYLKGVTNVLHDEGMMQKFLPYSSLLNVDEVEDVDKVWDTISKKIGVGKEELKEMVIPLSHVYSIAEHSRAVLVALHDDALPSNTGGGYNLRIIMRRMFSIIEQHHWDVDFGKVLELHADFLKPIYPELSKKIAHSKKILDIEYRKFQSNRAQAEVILSNLFKHHKHVAIEKLIELYDSNGISPETVKAYAKKLEITIEVPDNFYALVAEKHEQKEKPLATKKRHVEFHSPLLPTKILYYDDYSLINFRAKVAAVKDNNVVLEETAFYPTSGGQANDLGTLGGVEVVDVFKQGDVVVHVLKEKPSWKHGEEVEGQIDFVRRKQLAQHHTGAHIVNAACQKVIGPHCWQAGAAKTMEKGRLDVTHYDTFTDEEIKKIEKECNEIIHSAIPVHKEFLTRNEAEKRYGMRIYQGGFVPGKKLRIVSIGDKDVEACGGTHLNNTKEAEVLKIIRTSKIQDGIIRIEYTCGNAARSVSASSGNTLQELAKMLSVPEEEVPARCAELFEKWKKLGKARKKEGAVIEEDWKVLKSKAAFSGLKEDIVKEVCKILSSQETHVLKTVQRFLKEWDEMRK